MQLGNTGLINYFKCFLAHAKHTPSRGRQDLGTSIKSNDLRSAYHVQTTSLDTSTVTSQHKFT